MTLLLIDDGRFFSDGFPGALRIFHQQGEVLWREIYLNDARLALVDRDHEHVELVIRFTQKDVRLFFTAVSERLNKRRPRFIQSGVERGAKPSELLVECLIFKDREFDAARFGD